LSPAVPCGLRAIRYVLGNKTLDAEEPTLTHPRRRSVAPLLSATPRLPRRRPRAPTRALPRNHPRARPTRPERPRPPRTTRRSSDTQWNGEQRPQQTPAASAPRAAPSDVDGRTTATAAAAAGRAHDAHADGRDVGGHHETCDARKRRDRVVVANAHLLRRYPPPWRVRHAVVVLLRGLAHLREAARVTVSPAPWPSGMHPCLTNASSSLVHPSEHAPMG